jgi:hypothetical protein
MQIKDLQMLAPEIQKEVLFRTEELRIRDPLPFIREVRWEHQRRMLARLAARSPATLYESMDAATAGARVWFPRPYFAP